MTKTTFSSNSLGGEPLRASDPVGVVFWTLAGHEQGGEYVLAAQFRKTNSDLRASRRKVKALRAELRLKTTALERLHSLTEPGTHNSEIICEALAPPPKPKKRKARR